VLSGSSLKISRSIYTDDDDDDDDDDDENDDDAIGFNHARTPRTSDIDGTQVFVRSFLLPR
jgi:hypothetical protein